MPSRTPRFTACHNGWNRSLPDLNLASARVLSEEERLQPLTEDSYLLRLFIAHAPSPSSRALRLEGSGTGARKYWLPGMFPKFT